MNPADEAQAFSAIIEAGGCVETSRVGFLVLSRTGEPALVPQFYTESEVISEDDVVRSRPSLAAR